MNPFKRNDPVLFQGDAYEVKFVDGLDVLIEDTDHTHRLRVHYLTVQTNPWSN